jgi:hypothetical protein
MGSVVPSFVANLCAQKELRTKAMALKPFAGRSPAVSLTALAMQMNAVAAKPEVFVKRQLVLGCFSRRRMGHHVAQPATQDRYFDLPECHSLTCQSITRRGQ